MIWKWFSAVRPGKEQLLREEEERPFQPRLDRSDPLRTPEYLKRLDENVCTDSILLPSHYARKDYIHFLYNLRDEDGVYGVGKGYLLKYSHD